jgi:ankyrin repeat protein
MYDVYRSPNSTDNTNSQGGNTPLMLATQLNSPENSVAMVKLILSAQPIMEMKNKFGMTALMVAAKRGYASVVQQLLDAGADFCAVSEVMRIHEADLQSINSNRGVVTGK